jgi:hypothetical protein
MLQRLLHSTAMFVAIVVAYQAYVLAMVPWIEPPLAVRASNGSHAAPFPLEAAGVSVNKYQRILAAYFPPDHWSQTRPPKVIENDTGTVMFVLDDYERHDDGRVDLSHFALLIFPTPRQQSATPPRDAIILEAPQGAHLQFDKNFRPERGEVGSIQHGEFPGKITIRSDMREPGPADDLIVETTDLEMNSKLLFTPNEVHFRLGPNVGSGKELEIRLLEEETSKARAGLKIVSVDSLEVFKDVRLHLFLGAGSLLPGDKGDKSGRKAEQTAVSSPLGDPTSPPVEVTCAGPFHFDFIKYVAGFDDHVQVWQVNPEGPADQLSCDRLDLCFARKPDASEPPARATDDAAIRQRADVRWLEPDRIIAEGYPVVITSPSRDAEVRGRRVQVMLRQRKLSVEGGDDVAIAYGQNVVRAPQIQYQHPAADAGTKIGTFRASGPGTLHYVPDPKKPDQVFEADWQASVELGRHNGQPMLTVLGRPRLNVTGAGMLTADQVRVFLREVEVDGKTQPLPDRVYAEGQVEINSRELLARTRRLVANFRVEEPVAADAAAGPAAASSLTPFNLAPTAGPTDRQYQVQSDEMQLAVALRGKRAAPTTLACVGNVAFRQLPTGRANDAEPFEVRGGQLTVERMDADALVTIQGASPNASGQAGGEQLAQISGRGMTVHTASVKLDVGQDRLWIDGPGVAQMVLKRDFAGHETAPAPLELRWQGGLVFDGLSIVVDRNVAMDGSDDRLRCDRLAARLTSRVVFGKQVDQNAIDVEEVQCSGHVAMDHRSRDEVGVTSHERMELESLTVNQQTGAIRGTGPGVIRSTHLAGQLPGLTVPGPAAKSLSSSDAKLRFLRVDFQQGLEGNLINREITFLARVRTVYGPVDAWEQELDSNRPELLPPDTLTLTSNKLRVNEDPQTATHRARTMQAATGSPLGYVQMAAEGNVKIDGDSPQQGKFSATAERVSYTQAKEQFILEGSNRIPATLRHIVPATGQQVDNSAGKIIYNRLTGQAEWDTVREFEFTPGGGGRMENARGPADNRRQ